MHRALLHHVTTYWMERVWLAEPDPDRREALKRDLMSRHVAAWVDTYASQSLFEGPARLLETLDGALTGSTGALVVEIGTASGKDIAALAARHPGHRFLGTDLFPEAIDHARRAFALPNLAWETAEALAVPALLQRGVPLRRYVFANGVFTYLQPEHLQRLFAELAALPALDLFLCDPYHDDPDVAGSRFRGNFSWTHGYRRYAEAAGFSTRRFEARAQVVYWGSNAA